MDNYSEISGSSPTPSGVAFPLGSKAGPTQNIFQKKQTFLLFHFLN